MPAPVPLVPPCVGAVAISPVVSDVGCSSEPLCVGCSLVGSSVGSSTGSTYFSTRIVLCAPLLNVTFPSATVVIVPS